MENLGSGIERWEELAARYEQRLTRDRGQDSCLDDDLKQSIIEATLPDDLQKHIRMNAHRLPDYEPTRLEVITYLEAVEAAG